MAFTPIQVKHVRSKAELRIHWSSVITWIVLLGTGCIALWPMYWLFVTSLTPTTFAIKTPPDIFPQHGDLSNFQRLLSQASDYWTWGGNSLTVAISVTLFHIVFDTMAGYAFAKKRFPGRQFLFWVVISTMMVPAYVTLVPLYIVTKNLS